MKNLKSVLLTFHICLMVSCSSIKRQTSFNNLNFEIQQVIKDDIKKGINIDLIENVNVQKDTCTKLLASISQEKNIIDTNQNHIKKIKIFEKDKTNDNLKIQFAHSSKIKSFKINKNVKFYEKKQINSVIRYFINSRDDCIIPYLVLIALSTLSIYLAIWVFIAFMEFIIFGILVGLIILFGGIALAIYLFIGLGFMFCYSAN